MPDDGNTRLRALVGGRVQGVFFRDFVLSHAQRLGVVGTVQNLPDGGAVEVVAEGSRSALEELLTLLHDGPPHSHVRSVESKWSRAQGEFSSFSVI